MRKVLISIVLLLSPFVFLFAQNESGGKVGLSTDRNKRQNSEVSSAEIKTLTNLSKCPLPHPKDTELFKPGTAIGCSIDSSLDNDKWTIEVWLMRGKKKIWKAHLPPRQTQVDAVTDCLNWQGHIRNVRHVP